MRHGGTDSAPEEDAMETRHPDPAKPHRKTLCTWCGSTDTFTAGILPICPGCARFATVVISRERGERLAYIKVRGLNPVYLFSPGPAGADSGQQVATIKATLALIAAV
jgi:hypothetical protein